MIIRAYETPYGHQRKVRAKFTQEEAILLRHLMNLVAEACAMSPIHDDFRHRLKRHLDAALVQK